MLLVGPLSIVQPMTVKARITKELTNGEREMELEFPNGDEEYVRSITIPTVADLKSAHIGVSGLPLGSVMQYPEITTIDIGNNGKIDWMFSGQGYGSQGRQSLFINNSAKAQVVFDGPGTDTSLKVRLPADARITSATMKVSGLAHGKDWWDTDWLNRIPVRVEEPRGIDMGKALIDLWLDTSNFSISSKKEFRVIYDDGLVKTEVPSQVIDTREVSGFIEEARMIFQTLPLDANAVHRYYIYFDNSAPPDPPMVMDFRPHDIRNRLETPLFENGTGIKPTYFLEPANIALDGTDLYVADTQHHVIRIFDEAGTFQGQIGVKGVPGSDNDHLNGPQGVAVSQDGHIYVSDTDNNRIQVFKDDLSYEMTISNGTYIFPKGNNNLSSPHGLRVTDSGDIYVADTDNHIVQIFYPNGTLKDHIGSPGWEGSNHGDLNWPYDVCVREDDSVMIADTNNNRVEIFDNGLNYYDTIGKFGNGTGQFNFPFGIDCRDNRVYVADKFNQRVQVFSGTNYLKQYGITESPGLEVDRFTFPSAVKVDHRGVVHVVDTLNNRIVRIMDLDVALEDAEGIFPKDPVIDFGDDGLPEWHYDGTFEGSMSTPDMLVRLNVAIYSTPPFIDEWGNRMVDIPITISSEGQGDLRLEELDIKYDHLAVLDIGGIVSDILDNADTDQDDVEIPIKVMAKGGKVRISNISVEYDMPPTLIGDIPSTYIVMEDEHEPRLIDLNDLFKDDIDAPGNLTFLITSRTNASIVNTSIFEGHYLSVDSLNGSSNDNWFGMVELKVTAVNSRGLRTESNGFFVTIKAQNDRPIFVSTPITEALEGELYTYYALASDADNDVLTYSLSFGPEGMVIDEDSGTLTWTPTNTQTGSVEVHVQVSDGDPVGGRGRQSFNISVMNVNDLPVITSEPITEVIVGQEWKYTVLASDVDGDQLSYKLDRGPKGMKIDPVTGTIIWTPGSDQEGTHKVIISVFDGNASSEQEFEIDVKPSSSTAGGIPSDLFLIGLLLIVLLIIVIMGFVISRSLKKKKKKARASALARKRREREQSYKAKEQEEGVAEAEPLECPKCGDLIEDGLGYCTMCGYVIPSDSGEEVIPLEEQSGEDLGPGSERTMASDQGNVIQPDKEADGPETDKEADGPETDKEEGPKSIEEDVAPEATGPEAETGAGEAPVDGSDDDDEEEKSLEDILKELRS